MARANLKKPKAMVAPASASPPSASHQGASVDIDVTNIDASEAPGGYRVQAADIADEAIAVLPDSMQVIVNAFDEVPQKCIADECLHSI